MLNVYCVLRSGGIYDAEWVRKLRDGVARQGEYRFACLSDVPVPCERIALQHDWPGWWAKIELFRPGLISAPTLYLDLDCVVLGPLDPIFRIPAEFAMLSNSGSTDICDSSTMFFRSAPTQVYETFARAPEEICAHYEAVRRGSYVGDQAFIWDTLGGQIERIDDYCDGLVRSYKRHCGPECAPEGAAVVQFHGRPKPHELGIVGWINANWH